MPRRWLPARRVAASRLVIETPGAVSFHDRPDPLARSWNAGLDSAFAKMRDMHANRLGSRHGCRSAGSSERTGDGGNKAVNCDTPAQQK
jgi:hypothetical protein